MDNNAFPSREQLAYADILFYGCWIGLAVMLVTYVLYVFGIVSPHVPANLVPQYWDKPAAFYLKNADVPTGWGWVGLLGQGDFLNFIGIALLGTLSIICYLRVIPILLRRGDKLMACIAVLEVLILIVAASGLVSMVEGS